MKHFDKLGRKMLTMQLVCNRKACCLSEQAIIAHCIWCNLYSIWHFIRIQHTLIWYRFERFILCYIVNSNTLLDAQDVIQMKLWSSSITCLCAIFTCCVGELSFFKSHGIEKEGNFKWNRCNVSKNRCIANGHSLSSLPNIQCIYRNLYAQNIWAAPSDVVLISFLSPYFEGVWR